MAKAYDKVEWSYLRNVLIQLDFPINSTNRIMDCVTSVSLSILVNGYQTEYFKPSRGIRQGDPISPYLFVLCTEGLIALISDAIRNRIFKGVKAGQGSPR